MSHRVTVNVDQVKLPNGATYDTADVVILTDEEFSQISPEAFTDSVLTDGGVVGAGAVTTQAADVANMGALTSSADGALTAIAIVAANAATQTGSYVQADVQTIATLANSNKTQTNALVTDITALRTAYNQAQADIATLRTLVNTLLTNLRVAGGPML